MIKCFPMCTKVWRSLEAGRWIEEGPFEMSKEYPAAKVIKVIVTTNSSGNSILFTVYV